MQDESLSRLQPTHDARSFTDVAEGWEDALVSYQGWTYDRRCTILNGECLGLPAVDRNGILVATSFTYNFSIRHYSHGLDGSVTGLINVINACRCACLRPRIANHEGSFV
jgi:hypothetical protein